MGINILEKDEDAKDKAKNTAKETFIILKKNESLLILPILAKYLKLFIDKNKNRVFLQFFTNVNHFNIILWDFNIVFASVMIVKHRLKIKFYTVFSNIIFAMK
ncbi:MAG: hypothetical protein LBU55_02085 [Elusimicrobiota bacterium]|jgi:hypothetical protein|nr:hypothetical protein [Elusimicrobiota bacterium]